MLTRPVTSDSCAVCELTDNSAVILGFLDGWEGNLARFRMLLLDWLLPLPAVPTSLWAGYRVGASPAGTTTAHSGVSRRLQRIPFAQRPSPSSLFGRAAFLSATALFLAPFSLASTFNAGQVPSIFKPESTPADAIRTVSHFTLIITGLIFAVVTWLLVYVISKFRRTFMRDDYEPPQLYGSNQIELACTCHSRADRGSSVSGYRSGHSLRAGCAKASGNSASHGRGASVCAGVSLSRAGSGHGERAPCARERSLASYSDLI